MIKNMLINIRKRIKEIPVLNEENIKNHIVVNIFLRELGFDAYNWDYETTVTAKQNRVDITYLENGKPIFLVETKAQLIKNKVERDLSEGDVRQLLDYLNNYNEIKWGLLTNGSQYILLNKCIDGEPMDKIVFDLSINKSNKYEYWEYFSYQNLFVKKTSQFMADIAQFKSYKKMDNTFSEKSWAPYWSSIFRFLNYYSETHTYDSISQRPHEPLSKIDIDDFYAYISYITENPSNTKLVKSKETINSSYSYISSFFDTLYKKGYITDHNFKYGRENTLKDYVKTPKQKSENYLTEERYKQVLSFLWDNKNRYRNIVIFLLCAYYGFERSELLELSWEKNIKNNKIVYGQRQLPIIDLMKTCLHELYCEQKKMKCKQPKVLVTVYNNKVSSMSEWSINAVFDSLEKIDLNDKAWKVFSPKYVKMQLASVMFESGYSLEELVYYLGIDIKLITNYISSEVITNTGKERINKKKSLKPVHPFKRVTDDFYNEFVDI